MVPSKWRTECVGEGKEKEMTSQNNDRVRKLNGRCEDARGVDKENKGDATTQVVLVSNNLVLAQFQVLGQDL